MQRVRRLQLVVGSLSLIALLFVSLQHVPATTPRPSASRAPAPLYTARGSPDYGSPIALSTNAILPPEDGKQGTDTAIAAARRLGRAARVASIGLLELLNSDVVKATEAGSCTSSVVSKQEYTHRRRRRAELDTLEMAVAIQRASTRFLQLPAPLASPVRMVGEKPVCLSGFDMTKPFGAWKSTFHDVEVVRSGRIRPPPKGAQVLEAEPSPYVAVLSPGLSVDGYSINCLGTALTAGGCLWDVSAPKPLPWATAETVDVGVSLCDDWCRGYYHFTHEHLPRIALVHKVLETGQATLVLPHEMNEFQKQFIVDILGVKNVVVGVRVARTLLHPVPMRCGNTFSGVLHLFRTLTFSRLGLLNTTSVAATRKRKLLFAERGGNSRMASNHAELKDAVVSAFAEELDFETTRGEGRVADQVRRFYEADIVLGPHGANLANAMFMRPGTHLIEIVSAADGNMCYYTTAQRVGLVYHFVPHDKGKNQKFDLPPDLLIRHVRVALDQLAA